MKKELLVSLIILILTLLQESFFMEFFGAALNPNFVTALGFALLLSEEEDLAAFTMFIGGLFIDLMGTGVVGVSSFIFVAIVKLALLVKKHVFRGFFTQFVFIIFTTIVYKLAMNYSHFEFSMQIMFSGIINVVLSLLIYYVISRLKGRYLSAEYRIKA